MPKVLLVFGTRPEAIKMAPLYLALRESGALEVDICVTAQHRQMLDQVLEFFKIKPKYDLNLMQANQSLNGIFAGVTTGLENIFAANKYQCVAVHGDTTTSYAASVAAFHRQIPVVHIEAGLRTYNLHSPWPEEMNRQAIDKVSDLLFAPTEQSRQNLLKEGIDANRIHITGNTVIDALLRAVKIIETDKNLENALAEQFKFIDSSKKLILVTGHRRESFGAQFENICRGLERLAQRQDVQIVYPVHLNPQVQAPVYKILKDKENVHLISPQDYPAFVYLMAKSHLIITDSGGIQEEAPSLKKPVLVMRENTERQEVIDAGLAALVGTASDTIYTEGCKILDSNGTAIPNTVKNPYGDGNAARLIAKFMADRYLGPQK